jgi:hypothetical protein
VAKKQELDMVRQDKSQRFHIMNTPSPVLDRTIATNHPSVLATTKSWPLFGKDVRSSGSCESLTRVRLLTSLIDKNCDE